MNDESQPVASTAETRTAFGSMTVFIHFRDLPVQSDQAESTEVDIAAHLDRMQRLLRAAGYQIDIEPVDQDWLRCEVQTASTGIQRKAGPPSLVPARDECDLR